MLDFLRENRALLIDRLVARIVCSVPRYAGVDAVGLRQQIDRNFDDMLGLLERGEVEPLRERFTENARKRVEQGFTAADVIQASLFAGPVVRDLARERGMVADPAFFQAFDRIERTLHEMAAITAEAFSDSFAARLQAKNEALDRLNARLVAHEQSLSLEAQGVSRALEAAHEFSRRVIESLSAGLIAVDSATRRITLFSGRAEEILGIPTEEALGKDLLEALSGLGGVDFEQLVETVRTLGRLPVSRLQLVLADGRRRSVYVRAHRMHESNGKPWGTVVVFDDVTERELLFESFSRYVSRDLVGRLLARSQPLGLEGERRAATVLFVNLCGFAVFGETQSPEQLHHTLDAYFRAVVDGITLHGGLVDKFVGDKVMAIFGHSHDPGALQAVRAALAVKERIAAVDVERKARGESVLVVRIGVASGDVVLGNLGNEDRMEFTAIGDTVNVADALRHAARRGDVLLSESTARLIKDAYRLEAMAPITVEGRLSTLKAFRLVG